MGDHGEVLLKGLDSLIFFGKNHFLSSMYSSLIIAEGKPFPTVEHLYQFCKILSLAGKEAACEFVDEGPDVTEVKRVERGILRKYGVTRTETEKWRRNHGPMVLYYANALKYTQNRHLAQKLMDTKEKLLIEAFPGDNFFSAGMNSNEVLDWLYANEGRSVIYCTNLADPDALESADNIAKGKNVLGFLLMKLRSAFHEYSLLDMTDDRILQSILSH